MVIRLLRGTAIVIIYTCLFRKQQAQFLTILDDMDRLLLSHDSFLLGNWVSAAHNLATSEEDRNLFRMNALNQLTLWGPNGEITDYAGKQWAGLVKR